ncbi:hypothetical protein ES705_20555 [subsurface metagenome]
MSKLKYVVKIGTKVHIASDVQEPWNFEEVVLEDPADQGDLEFSAEDVLINPQERGTWHWLFLDRDNEAFILVAQDLVSVWG